MAFLSPSWGLLGALALIVVLSLSGVAVQTARLGASQASEKAVRADLEDRNQEVLDLRAANAKLARMNTQQSTQRKALADAVQATQETIVKEAQQDATPKPVLSGARLERMQRLTDSANAAIRSASELP